MKGGNVNSYEHNPMECVKSCDQPHLLDHYVIDKTTKIRTHYPNGNIPGYNRCLDECITRYDGYLIGIPGEGKHKIKYIDRGRFGGGARLPTTQSDSKTKTYVKTNRIHTFKDGTQRTVYRKDGKDYVKRKSPKTGKYVYRPI